MFAFEGLTSFDIEISLLAPDDSNLRERVDKIRLQR
jgi:hypothetical protein